VVFNGLRIPVMGDAVTRPRCTMAVVTVRFIVTNE
jgi:hypothetical protein